MIYYRKALFGRGPKLTAVHMLLCNLLIYIIFTAPKAQVARSNRAGQAKGLTGP